MSFQMIRPKLPHKRETDQTDWQNSSLFLDKGFQKWETNDGDRGEAIGKHIKVACEIDVPEVYKAAYTRWLGETANKESFARWFGKLDGTRLFIGLGMDHALEAQVCRHPVYGMPYIPGSALKGLARAEAKRYAKKQEEEESKKFNKVIDILFGPDCNDSDDPEAEANTGYLIFHDAWWIPGGKAGGCQQKPYIPEIVTVHAVEYYTNQGKKEAPHPDMESPNPNHQIAVQGSFYFVVEGVQQWAELGMKFLTLGLQEEGIGGKISAGYGYFVWDEKTKKNGENIAREWVQKTKEAQQQVRINNLSESEYLVYTLNKLVEEYQKNSKVLGERGRSKILQQAAEIEKYEKWPALYNKENALVAVAHAKSVATITKKKSSKKRNHKPPSQKKIEARARKRQKQKNKK